MESYTAGFGEVGMDLGCFSNAAHGLRLRLHHISLAKFNNASKKHLHEEAAQADKNGIQTRFNGVT